MSVTDRAGHADSLLYVVVFGFSSKILLNTTQSGVLITEDVLDFPLLVRLDNTNFHFAEAKGHGEDIRFAKPDGTSLPYETERWDSIQGRAEIWVKVDTVHPSNNTQYLVMSWGNKNAVNGSRGSSVFDTAQGYIGIWHMNDGLPAQNRNSAQGQFDATPIGGGANPAISYGSGIIAGADSLANSKYLNAGLLPAMQNVSMSAWVNPTVTTPFIKIICKSWNNYGGPWQVFSLELSGSKDSTLEFHVGLSEQFSAYAVNKDSVKTGTWTHLAGTYDGLTMLLYVNGMQAGAYSWTNSPVPAVPANQQQPWTIGGWSFNQGECFSGKIDEARIYRGVWGPDHIRLSYENQRQGSAFVTIK